MELWEGFRDEASATSVGDLRPLGRGCGPCRSEQLVLLLHGSPDVLDLPSAAWTHLPLCFPLFTFTHLFFFFFVLIKLLKVFLVVLKTDGDYLLGSHMDTIYNVT